MEEKKWRDSAIRWPDDKKTFESDEEEEEEETGFMDPFKDPDPFQMFDFQFKIPNNIDKNVPERSIDVKIRGFKTDADEIWESTGLTLWRASDYLCEYQVENVDIFDGKRVLELGAGLGLNGILVWLMTKRSTIVITDGDTTALVHLRENIERNRPSDVNEDSSTVSCSQLLWGKETSLKFLEIVGENKKYDVLLASDIIYAQCIIQPLWETVQTLLNRSNGLFVMAFAKRKVPVSIAYVLESAEKNGFSHEKVKEDTEEGIWVYLFRFKEESY